MNPNGRAIGSSPVKTSSARSRERRATVEPAARNDARSFSPIDQKRQEGSRARAVDSSLATSRPREEPSCTALWSVWGALGTGTFNIAVV